MLLTSNSPIGIGVQLYGTPDIGVHVDGKALSGYIAELFVKIPEFPRGRIAEGKGQTLSLAFRHLADQLEIGDVIPIEEIRTVFLEETEKPNGKES